LATIVRHAQRSIPNAQDFKAAIKSGKPVICVVLEPSLPAQADWLLKEVRSVEKACRTLFSLETALHSKEELCDRFDC
jgi:hypothetical protein